jgi:hypothetical protein
MRDPARVAFLVTVDAMLIALLVALLNGCGATPIKFRDYRDRTGDFVTNIASAAQEGPKAGPSANTATARADGKAWLDARNLAATHGGIA